MKKIILWTILLSTAWLSCGHGIKNGPRITFATGAVQVDGKGAAIDMPVPHGSEVRTGQDSGCDIMVSDGTILRLKENSDIILYYDGTSGCININSGTIMGVFRWLNPAKKGVFTLKTTTTSAVAKGTTIFIKVENPDSTYLCNCNGIVLVRDAFFSDSREMRSVHHQAARIRRTYRGLAIEDTQREYHTDREMESLALKAGYILNWREMENY